MPRGLVSKFDLHITIDSDSEESDPIGDALRADAVAYWKLEESSGTRQDATENNHDLGVLGTVGSVTGKIGDAANLTVAADNGLRLLNDSAFQCLGKSTISFWGWAKIDDFDPGNEDHAIIGSNNEGNTFSTNDYILAFNTFAEVGENKVRLEAYDAEGEDYIYLEHSLSPVEGQWFFFMFTIDVVAQLATLIINSTEETQGFYSTPAVANPGLDNTLCVGSQTTVSSPSAVQSQINGSCDEIGCLHRALTTEEKGYLLNAGSGRSLY